MASNKLATTSSSSSSSSAARILIRICIFIFGWNVSAERFSHMASHHQDNDIRKPIQVFGPSNVSASTQFNVVCFYDLTNVDSGGLQPETIDAHLCTHIITGYAKILNNSIQDTDEHVNAYPRVMNLKRKNPTLKIMLMAGSGSNSTTAEMVSTKENRASFINQSISYLSEYGFDGFDLDWEFPAWGTDPPEDKDLLIVFLKEFRESIEYHSWMTGRIEPLILSMDVSASIEIIGTSYNITEMALYLTFVNIMCYDYHFYQWFFPFTGQNSPLFNRSVEQGIFSTMNTAWSANYWHGQGMPKEKIHVGMPTYGYTYSLTDPTSHGLDAPASGPGIHSGGSTYAQACQFLADGAISVMDDESLAPYAYRGYDWLSYDNEESVITKTKWSVENGFAGVMVFELNHDDWQGECNTSSARTSSNHNAATIDAAVIFPLVRAIRNATDSRRST